MKWVTTLRNAVGVSLSFCVVLAQNPEPGVRTGFQSNTIEFQARKSYAEIPISRIYGLNFSPYLNGQDPNQGVQISASQVQARLQIVAPYTRWIRSFSPTSLQRISKLLGPGGRSR